MASRNKQRLVPIWTKFNCLYAHQLLAHTILALDSKRQTFNLPKPQLKSFDLSYRHRNTATILAHSDDVLLFWWRHSRIPSRATFIFHILHETTLLHVMHYARAYRWKHVRYHIIAYDSSRLPLYDFTTPLSYRSLETFSLVAIDVLWCHDQWEEYVSKTGKWSM